MEYSPKREPSPMEEDSPAQPDFDEGSQMKSASLWNAPVANESNQARITTSLPNNAETSQFFQSLFFFQSKNRVPHDVMSVTTDSTYQTAPSRFGTESVSAAPGQLDEDDEFAQLLKSKRLWPVEEAVEQNWSGRGEHLRLLPSDREFLKKTLEPRSVLGRTSTAVVDSVKCRRILLARKTISCNRQFTKAKALEEFVHLKKLEHCHIVRVIGTYVLSRKLSILMYPVARYNMETFLEATIEERDGPDRVDMRSACRRFFSCLSSAVDYLHSKFTKHMDIKPQNILIHERKYTVKGSGFYGRYTVLITDFGIARSYPQLEVTETDGPTMFTRKYAAPEVVLQDTRGLSADIFSLGCVFLEMIATMNEVCAPKPTPEDMDIDDTAARTGSNHKRDLTMDRLQTLLETSESGPSYHCNIEAIFAELTRYIPQPKETEPANVMHLVHLIRAMVRENPLARPSAHAVLDFFKPVRGCCDAGPLPLEDSRLQLGF